MPGQRFRLASCQSLGEQSECHIHPHSIRFTEVERWVWISGQENAVSECETVGAATPESAAFLHTTPLRDRARGGLD